MQIDGYGGRGDYGRDNLVILAGLIDFDDHELMPVRFCANPKCGHRFRPRADGDDYCNERCDPLNKFKSGEGNHED